MKTTTRKLTLACLAALGFAGAAQAATLQIYKQPNFTGAEITLNGETPNLQGLGFANQGSSLVLTGDRWEICSQPDFKGDCVILNPGRYPTLDARLNHRMESIRPLGVKIAEAQRNEAQARHSQVEQRREAREERRDDRRDERRDDRRDDRRDARPADVELYSGAGFRGRPMSIGRDDDHIDGFFDRGSSLVVNEGQWMVCSEPGYRGRCRVYGPGRYETLARLGDVGSMRRVR